MLSKALQISAANAGGESVYVDDVFSTFLYTGNGSTQGINNGIALGDFGVGTSTQFNGTSDYLNRLTDLDGNTDGKTFTLSCWVFLPPKLDDNQRMIYATDSSDNGIMIYIQSNNTIGIEAWNGGVRTLQASTSTTIGTRVWTNIIISLDTANTSNRYVYFNDVAASVTWSTYNNANIEFTRPTHYVGAWGNGTRKFYGDFAHLYLDYTYRDLSVQANRRIFIDANGGSTSESTLSALSPILYLPMTEAYSINSNLGTGGAFTINGTPIIVQNGTQYVSGYGEGGLVWIKRRSSTGNHQLFDTARGTNYRLMTDLTTESQLLSNHLNSFNATGFTLGSSGNVNESVSPFNQFCSWTFRKAPKFFDVVTYTANSVNGRAISHNLGSVPGMVIFKSTTNSSQWYIWHNGLNPTTEEIYFNTNAKSAGGLFTQAPTSTELYLSSGNVNFSGLGTLVAYLFAHDAGGFGDAGDENVISCGSLTTDSGGLATVNLGYEPQWLMIKRTATSGDWQIVDSMRGFVNNPSGGDAVLIANGSNAESTFTLATPTSTGFLIDGNVANTPIIYIAIRRPMKTPESGTEVFEPVNGVTVTGNGTPWPSPNFAPDTLIMASRNGVENKHWFDRLRGTPQLQPNVSDAEGGYTSSFWAQNGFAINSAGGGWVGYIGWNLRRASGFFDVVCYTGNGGGARTLNHNLTVPPEIIITKARNDAASWQVYLNQERANLNLAFAFSPEAYTASTSTQFTVLTYSNTAHNHVAYLFATLAGVSKVGGYTGNGYSQTINCGFTGGARFIMIKRTDASGDWYVWDSARGIVDNNDPHLSLNSTAAEVTTDDSVDPANSGFIVNQVAATDVNVNAASYIFLAIA